MEPKLCTTCGERPALPGDDECSICLLGYDSAEAKKTEWKPLLSGGHVKPGSGFISGWRSSRDDEELLEAKEDLHVEWVDPDANLCPHCGSPLPRFQDVIDSGEPHYLLGVICPSCRRFVELDGEA